MAPTLPSFSPARLRSYLVRLPLLTRGVLLLIALVWLLELGDAWQLDSLLALEPAQLGLQSSPCRSFPTRPRPSRPGQRLLLVRLC